MINWHVSETTVKNNSLISVIVASAQTSSVVDYVVTCPNGDTYASFIELVNGQGAADLYVNSGNGAYSITLSSSCEQVIDATKLVIASCCLPSATACTLEIVTNKAAYNIGEIANIYIVNATPVTPVFVIANKTLHTVTPDANGHGLLSVQMVELGNYVIQAHQNTCLATPLSLTVVGTPNAVPSVANPAPACTKPLTSTPRFSRTGVTTGTNVALTITVCNENSGALSYSLPALTLPSELSSATPITITNEIIPSKTCRDFNFVVSCTNPTNEQITSVLTLPAHTYLCEGVTFSVLSGEDSLAIFAAAQSCGIEVTQFTITSTGASAAEIKLVVTNLGSANISQLTLYPLTLPSSLGGGTIDFNNVALASGASYTYTKQVVTSNTTGAPLTAVVFIPVNGISTVCNSAILTDDESHTASLLIPA